MPQPHIAILGAGPAGVGAAYQLRRLDRARVTVLEQQAVPGGNAGSFELDGLRVDYGSHRLHPACDPAILADIRRLLGSDLLDRPRHGRIRLRGRWIHFPLHPVDLLLRLDPAFALGTLRDVVLKPFRSGGTEGESSFAEELRASLGPTICDSFYFPYARKIWGRSPTELSAIQARRRVSASSFSKLARKLLSQIPGLKPPGAGRFFYPRHGYGQISEAYASAALAAGAQFRYGSRVSRVTPPLQPGGRWVLEAERGGAGERLEADQLWSTLPIPLLARLMEGHAPAEVHEAAAQLEYRAMVLIYLVLPQAQFSEYDAHYFPGADLRVTRVSEPKNYAARSTPLDRTVLCAELPCSPDEPAWRLSDAALGTLVTEDLERAGIGLSASPVRVEVRRLRQAYPIYSRGYERWFGVLDAWVESLPRCLSYGRQGLFAHDNTHHALAMAYAAADCVEGAEFRRDRWAEYRRVFDTHVVED
ncbi:MAG TPA: FAD-dependent oxidoreductase [Gemmatimonadales bacterium]|nr:FAD-dependent oxidoreductase [Gemmatimonadales bacterium]